MQLRLKTGTVNRLARPLGVELEMINTAEMQRQFNYTFGTWEHDGTIKPTGSELVLSPASGDKFIQQIVNTYAAIERFKPGVNATCGFHVHVQGGDLNPWDIRKLIAVWHGIEPDVYKYLVESARVNSAYAIPFSKETNGDITPWQFSRRDVLTLMRHKFCVDGEKIKIALIKKLYRLNLVAPQSKDPALIQRYRQASAQFDMWKKNKRTPGQAAGQGCRYASLNLHSWFHRGTVEFRLKEGTLDPEELVFWPLFCGWIVHSVEKISDTAASSVQSLMDWITLTDGIVQPEVLQWVLNKINNKKETN